MSRMNKDAWAKAGRKHIYQVAEDKVAQRPAAYEKPEINPDIEKELTDCVVKRKNK